MRKCPVLLTAFIFLAFTAQAMATGPERFTVMFYNVENLFDIQDDPAVNDDEFTPGGAKQWDRKRYDKKLDDLGKVLSSLGSLPEVIGLAEVENRGVLEDLVNRPAMAKGNYGIIHRDSPDARGIDVALLYRMDRFKFRSQRFIRINLPNDTVTTRDILYMSGTTAEGDLLHLFVNHWSSRTEGEQVTERRRIYNAVILRKAVDSIINYEPAARIIIMGDFNDEPTNTSLHNILNANNKRKNANAREFYNLMYDMHNADNLGTYNYKGNWNMLDQIIVSRAMVRPDSGYGVDWGDGRILKEDWMMTGNVKVGEPIPNRTYGGNQYYGGISDHLPVYVILKYR